MSDITINPERKMTKAEAEMHEKAIFDNIHDSGKRLLKICVEKGWEAMGHETFRQYCGYLDGKLGSMAKMYRLLDTARVNHNLSTALKREVTLPVQHALALKDLEPEQQVIAFNDATKGYKKGDPKPTEKAFKKAAYKVAPKPKASRKTRDPEAGWSKDAIEKDEELKDHFDMIETIFGKDDTDAIKDGTVPMKRADVIYLARLPKERMESIQDLLFTTRWAPKQCIEFINTDLDDNSTIEDLKNLCLSTRGKFWSGEFGGFSVSVKANKKIR